MSNLVRVFINEIEVFVPPNSTVLEAAEKVGVQVCPSLRQTAQWKGALRMPPCSGAAILLPPGALYRGQLPHVPGGD
jgi:hypothetical protein